MIQEHRQECLCHMERGLAGEPSEADEQVPADEEYIESDEECEREIICEFLQIAHGCPDSDYFTGFRSGKKGIESARRKEEPGKGRKPEPVHEAVDGKLQSFSILREVGGQRPAKWRGESPDPDEFHRCDDTDDEKCQRKISFIGRRIAVYGVQIPLGGGLLEHLRPEY